MVLKYQDEIDKFECNLNNFKEQDREAYRWTFENINNSKNFRPIYYLQPKRKRNTYKGWALSFFNSNVAAKKRLLELTATKKKLFKKLGTHIAKGKLSTRDGISEKVDGKGHFNHFEYENVDLLSKFTIIEQVEHG
jgi:hypothetical protein